MKKKTILAAILALIILTVFSSPVLAGETDDLNADGYNDNDFNKVQAFLNLPSAIDGKTNGQAINASYDQNEPSTWGSVYWNTDVPKRVNYIYWVSSSLAGNADFSGFDALEQLYIFNNEITSVNISGDTLLQYLDVQNNNLSSLDVSDSTNLIFLGCSDNNLESLDVSGLTQLSGLYCINNKLTDLDFSGCTALRELYCSKNKLSGLLDVSAFDNLEYLDYSDNLFTSLITGDSVKSIINGLNNPVTLIKTDIVKNDQTFSVNGKGYISFNLDEFEYEIYLYGIGHSNELFYNWTINGEEVSKSPVYYMNPEDPISDDVTANFRPGITSSSPDGVMYEGARVTLTPLFAGGVWQYDSSFLKADFSNPDKPVFTALKPGTTRVYYTAPDYVYDENPYEGENEKKGLDGLESQSDENEMQVYMDITIKAAKLPLTGQSFTAVVILAFAGVLMLSAAAIINKKRKSRV